MFIYSNVLKLYIQLSMYIKSFNILYYIPQKKDK